jgi:hypothetical protein
MPQASRLFRPMPAPPKLARCEHCYIDAVAVIEQVLIIRHQCGSGGLGQRCKLAIIRSGITRTARDGSGRRSDPLIEIGSPLRGPATAEFAA